LFSVFKSLSGRGKPPTEERLNSELVKRGIIPQGQTLETFSATDILGQDVADVATLRNVMESKLILASYRLAGLEGQRGQGLSDKDVQRMDKILAASSNPDVFRENLADYFRDKVEAVRTRGETLRNYNEGMFKEQYGYNPMESAVLPLEAAVDARPEVKKGYDFVMNTQSTVDRIRNRPQQTPAQAQPQEQPERTPHRSVSGYSPAGWTPEGKPVYRDDKTGQMVTE
jgi:hypothetical protein